MELFDLDAPKQKKESKQFSNSIFLGKSVIENYINALQIGYINVNLKNPVIREEGALNGKGFKKMYATNSSIASSTKQAENRCDATHRFASLHMKRKKLYAVKRSQIRDKKM